MSKKPVTTKAEAANIVKDIRRATRNVHSAEEKIRIVLAGLRGEDSIADPPNCGIKLSELMRWMPPPAGIVYHDGSIFA
jgi:hypothetical protein